MLAEIDGQLRVARGPEFAPSASVPRNSGEGDWSEFEYASATEDGFELAFIHGSLANDRVQTGMKQNGLTLSKFSPGTIRTEWIELDVARNYFNSPTFDASAYTSPGAPPRYLIIETAGTDTLEYEFTSGGSTAANLSASLLRDVFGLDVGLSTRIEQGGRLVIDEPRLIGYALVQFSALLEGKLGSGGLIYVDLEPVEAGTYAHLADLEAPETFDGAPPGD